MLELHRQVLMWSTRHRRHVQPRRRGRLASQLRRDRPRDRKGHSEVVVILTDVEKELFKSRSAVELALVKLRKSVHETIEVLVRHLRHFLNSLVKVGDPNSILVYLACKQEFVRRRFFVQDWVVGQAGGHEGLSHDGQIELAGKRFLDIAY